MALFFCGCFGDRQEKKKKKKKKNTALDLVRNFDINS